MTYNRKSPFVKFAEKYCDKMGLYEVDATGHKMYDEGDILDAIFIKRDYDYRNRGNNSKKVKV
jgi:hypothetical protein